MDFNQIKTFEDACKVEGLDVEKVTADLSNLPDYNHDREAIAAHMKLLIIARAINRLANGGIEWKPDWTDYNQPKYFPYFEMRGPSGFQFDGYDNWHSLSYVGSRLCFKSREAGEHAGRQFTDLYQAYMVIQ